MDDERTDSNETFGTSEASKIRTQCPHCEAKFRTKRENEGKRAKCRKCGDAFVIESLTEILPILVPRESEGQTGDQSCRVAPETKRKKRTKLYLATSFFLAVPVIVAALTPSYKYKHALDLANETATVQGWEAFVEKYPDASDGDHALEEIDRLRYVLSPTLFDPDRRQFSLII